MMSSFPCFLKHISELLERLASPPLDLNYVSPKPFLTLLMCMCVLGAGRRGMSLNTGTTYLQVTITLGREQHIQTKLPPKVCLLLL